MHGGLVLGFVPGVPAMRLDPEPVFPRALIELRDQGVISDGVPHRLEQELDIEAIRIGADEERLPGHSHR